VVARKCFANWYAEGDYQKYVFNAAANILISILMILWSGIGSMSFTTVWMGAVYGVFSTVYVITSLKAMEIGTVSYTNVIISMSTLIPALSGVIAFGETISVVQIIGIVFMCVCFFLSVETAGKDGEQKKVTFLWLLCCFWAFIGNGMLGVMQKWHQNTLYKMELNEFLLVSYIVSSVFSVVYAVMVYKKQKFEVKTMIFQKKWLIAVVLFGVTWLLTDIYNTYLAGVMDSAVFFPVYNGLTLCLVIVSALVIFKERPEKRQWAGILVGIVAVVLLCDPF